MNHFEIYKKNRKEGRISPLFFIALFFVIVLFPGDVLNVFATESESANVASSAESPALTAEEKEAIRRAEEEAERAAQAEREAAILREKIATKNNELEEIKATIETYTKQVETVHGETKTLQGAIKILDLDRQKMSSSIKLTENRLESTNLNIDRLNLEVAETEKRIDASEDAIAEIIRTTDQADSRSIIETVLAKSNLSEILDESFQLGQFRNKISAHMSELEEFKKDRLHKKTEREGEKKNLIGYKAELVDKKIILDNTRKEQKNLLAVTQNKEINYRKILEENIAKKEAFEKELFDYENQLKRQLDQKFIPEVGSKILMWPLDVIRITQHFGRTKDSVRLYSSGTHNGVDFAANRGTPVKAPAGGTIIGVGDTDKTCPKGSYGKWILIKHNNGLATLFGHLDLIKVAEGQKVSVGDIVAYTGNTGYSTGPHLHMTLFASEGVQVGSFASKACSGKSYVMPLPTAKNAYLDPEAYF